MRENMKTILWKNWKQVERKSGPNKKSTEGKIIEKIDKNWWGGVQKKH